MNSNGFHAPMTGGRRIFAVAMIVALMLAALPVASVFAQDGGPTGGNDNGGVSANQIRELQSAQTWFNNFRTKPGQQRNNAKISQYLDQYAFALRQANAILVGGGTNANTEGNNANGQGNNNNTGQGNNGNNQGNSLGFGSSSQQFAAYLSMMRGLREKIANASKDEGNNTNNNTGSGVGIPVTGDSGAPTTSNNQNTQTISPAQKWGGQWRELQQAQAWYNNFRTKPGQNRNSERVSRYLDQYAFALRQANAIIAGGVDANNQGNNANNQGNNQGNNTDNQGNNQQRWGSSEQLLNMYLQWMRGLRVKIANGGPENNFNNTNSTGGTP